ncbi:hypothetical protein SRABI76_01341 [Microbacterium oxydans]|uniref:hypothetical protein n=1 Tax=Microbacterium oxydans TaxID=82380 RepID=UPI001DF5FCB0|nr:hypothetical protein [Microbacterium oxydans]CAH0173400.1 hypothetical protein SRABI76_01341 [Microbacterium oxydans]
MSLRLWSATAALVTALVVIPSASVAADTAPEPPAACTVGGVSVPDGSPLPTDIPTVVSCFDSVEEAEQFIEAGAPGDLEQLQPAQDAARGTTARAAASTVIVGKAWTGASRSGTALLHWGAGAGCFGTTFGFPSLASGWNNNIRSAEGLVNCWSVQYDLSNYGGTFVTCSSYCSGLGTMAARTSSIVYRPAG